MGLTRSLITVSLLLIAVVLMFAARTQEKSNLRRALLFWLIAGSFLVISGILVGTEVSIFSSGMVFTTVLYIFKLYLSEIDNKKEQG